MGTAECAADIFGRLASVLGSPSLICLPWSPCEKRRLFHAPQETRGKAWGCGKKAQAWGAAVSPLGGPERPAPLGSRQALPREALGIPAAKLLISWVMGAGHSRSGRSYGPGTIGACLLTEMTNGGGERQCVSMKKSMGKRKCRVQIAVMIFKGRRHTGVSQPTMGPSFQGSLK